MYWSLFVAIFIAVVDTTEAEIYTRFVNLNCSVNDDYLTLKTCFLKAFSREKVTLTVEYDIIKEVKNVTVHFRVQKRTSTGRYFPYLYDLWANFCDTVKERPNTSFIVRQIKRLLARYSNAVRCVHKPGSYYMRNAELPFDLIKFFVETGRYTIFFEFYQAISDKYTPAGNGTFSIDILEKYRRPKKKGKV